VIYNSVLIKAYGVPDYLLPDFKEIQNDRSILTASAHANIYCKQEGERLFGYHNTPFRPLFGKLSFTHKSR
jgi:hypothetical protein